MERKTDTYGFDWMIIRDPDLEDQITSVHAVAQEMTDQGFGDRLLAEVALYRTSETWFSPSVVRRRSKPDAGTRYAGGDETAPMHG